MRRNPRNLKKMSAHNSCGEPDWYYTNRLADVPAGTKYEEVLAMLERRIDALEEELMLDKALRAKYPALQDLYEQYKTTKSLITGE